MKKIHFVIIAATLIFAATDASAALKLHSTISDGMVLQQCTQARIWGTTDPGASVRVSVSWDSRNYSVVAGDDGKWEIKVCTPEASYTAHSIVVKSAGTTMTVRDVLVGEVWLASGQSNMEMPIRGFFNCPVEGSSEVVAGAAMPDRIRMLTVPVTPSLTPLDDVRDTRGWEKAGPETVSEMSATAYFFARQVNASLDVPVGIVCFARGGSRVEGWLPEATLAAMGEPVSGKVLEDIDSYNTPFVFYNGMEQAVKGYTGRGFIWYQGCSNVGSDGTFVERMTELVRQWRDDWGDASASMPFYMVEIAPYNYGSGAAAALRAAQHVAAAVIPNAGIVVTNDLVYDYEADNIHPCRKLEVGQRLAYMALHRNYGFSRLACDSPEALSARLSEPGAVKVKLSNCPNGLNRLHGVRGLEVCGSDGVWKPVCNVDFDWRDSSLSIRCEGIGTPAFVRYGWGDFVPGNLGNAEALGLVPFCLRIKNLGI